ncbi:hypothetical protein BCR33DRAFT_848242 [Rhizoclosmatium globosum]|uniref:Gfd2/YDR514C-like C-terminal domain-containing protein n=1 Tax=Rhizoclosmatium globosum TaxID=329046 RepID=A0A1Y2CMI0_9FUNG|nr:hypothetical protein BCR33DRAFT_848242 [Rhizoclosmatium globosum]|eukprot:ORY48213.1 hypothetical protein BCR33DRAFT_848242 [Rhizoclosmatium globosum]
MLTMASTSPSPSQHTSVIKKDRDKEKDIIDSSLLGDPLSLLPTAASSATDTLPQDIAPASPAATTLTTATAATSEPGDLLAEHPQHQQQQTKKSQRRGVRGGQGVRRAQSASVLQQQQVLRPPLPMMYYYPPFHQYPQPHQQLFAQPMHNQQLQQQQQMLYQQNQQQQQQIGPITHHQQHRFVQYPRSASSTSTNSSHSANGYGSVSNGNVRRVQSRPQMQQNSHQFNNHVHFQTPPTSSASHFPAVKHHNLTSSPVEDRKESGGLDGDDSVGGASGVTDNTAVADEDCAVLSPTTNGDGGSRSSTGLVTEARDLSDEKRGRSDIIAESESKSNLDGGVVVQNPHGLNVSTSSSIPIPISSHGAVPSGPKVLSSRKSFTTLPQSRKQHQQQVQQVLFTQQHPQYPSFHVFPQQQFQQSPPQVMHYPPSIQSQPPMINTPLFQSSTLPMPPPGMQPYHSPQSMMPIQQSQQNPRYNSAPPAPHSIMSPPAPYEFMPPPPHGLQQSQNGWLFGGTETYQSASSSMQTNTFWKKKTPRRGKRKSKQKVDSETTTTSTPTASDSIGSSSGGTGTSLSLDAVPFSPMEMTSNEGSDDFAAVEDAVSAIGVAGSVITVPDIPGTKDESRSVSSASHRSKSSDLPKSPSRVVHPLPPKPPVSPKVGSRLKEQHLEVSVGLESAGGSSDATETPKQEASSVLTTSVTESVPSATSVKKVIKAVSVTRSNVIPPDGPYARVGDLYSFVKKQVSGRTDSEYDWDTLVKDAFGFSKAGDVWPAFLSKLETDVFAIGTASSDKRRHLLIPSSLFPKAHRLVSECIRQRIGLDVVFDLAPFYVAQETETAATPRASRSYASAAAAPVSTTPVLPPASLFETEGDRTTFSDLIGIRIESADDYAAVHKALEKHKKEMKRIERDARESAFMLRKLGEARRLVSEAQAGKTGAVFLSLDIEAFEMSQDKILEIGWTLFNPKVTGAALVAKHFILEENQHLKNGRFVADARHEFRFGDTEVECLDYVVQLLKLDLNMDDASGSTAILVGHAVSGDIQWLKSCGVHLSLMDEELGADEESVGGAGDVKGKKRLQPSESSTSGPATSIHSVFDTAELDCALHGRLKAQRMSVKKMCEALGIVDDESDVPFHNAGNDAYLTMQAFLKMAATS